MDIRKLVHEGYLRKSPPDEKIGKNYRWKKRYFKLWSDQTLEYYKNKSDTRPLREPIELKSCLGIIEMKPEYMKHLKSTRFKWSFCLTTPHRSYNLAAISETGRDEWKKYLGEVCGFGSSLTRTVEDIHDIMTVEGEHRDSISSKDSNLSKKSICTVSSSDPGSGKLIRANAAKCSAGDDDDSSSGNSFSDGDEDNDDDGDNTYSTPRSSLSRTCSLSVGASNRRESFGSTRKSSVSIRHEKNTIPHDIDGNYLSMTGSDSVYDTPKNHVRVNPINKWSSIKQVPTKIHTNTELGYVQMDPSTEVNSSTDDYMHMVDKPSQPNVFTGAKKFKEPINLIFDNKSQTLQQRKPLPVSSPQRATTLKHLSRQPPSRDETHLDHVPTMLSKHIIEPQIPDEAPPDVNREAKPSPSIDRSTKPKLTKQMSYVGPSRDRNKVRQTNLNMSFDAAQFQRARDEPLPYTQHNIIQPLHFTNNNIQAKDYIGTKYNMYSNHKLKNGSRIHPNITTPNIDEALDNSNAAYSNIELQDLRLKKPISEYCNNILDDSSDNYTNIASVNITFSASAIHTECDEVFSDVQNIDYIHEQLPEVPCENVIRNNNNQLTGYENMQALPRSPTEDLTYVECRATRSSSVIDEIPIVGGSSGDTHYILVDTERTQAAKMLR